MSFKVPKGTACKVRKIGASDWTANRTREENEFESFRLADGGMSWIFERDGWELKVPASVMMPRKLAPADQPRKPSKCRDCKEQEDIPRYMYFKANKPRCGKCGGMMDYPGGWNVLMKRKPKQGGRVE